MTDWTSLLTIERVDAFGAGVYVLMAVIHLDLWLHRKDRPTHLWLAISALGALLVNITGQLVRPLLPNAPQCCGAGTGIADHGCRFSGRRHAQRHSRCTSR